MSLTASSTPGAERVSQSVVEAVAAAEGVPPEELSPPLYDVVDPDALGRLFTSTHGADRTDGRVDFSYVGHRITVFGDGTVAVDGGDASDTVSS